MSLDVGYLSTAFVDTITKNYFNFDGRTSRFGFWHFFLAYLVFAIVLTIVLSFLGGLGDKLSTLVSLALLLPTLGIGARRLHDTGKSGWFQLLLIIPILGLIALIVLWAQPGDAGANAHGGVPATKAV